MSTTKIVQRNANGELAHAAELKNVQSIFNYDVICIQETVLKPRRNINFTGNNIIRKDRLENNHGGLVLLVQENLNFTEIEKRVQMQNESIK